MNVSTLQEVKQELLELSQEKLIELCISLAKYKKDNKEFLDYLLFHAHDRSGFVELVKAETDTLFTELQVQKHPYYAKKGLRRILRILNKYCRYIDEKTSTIEIQIYFCKKIKEDQIPINKDGRLQYLYSMQLVKINKLIEKLHEDLQDDYKRDLQEIMAMR